MIFEIAIERPLDIAQFYGMRADSRMDDRKLFNDITTKCHAVFEASPLADPTPF